MKSTLTASFSHSNKGRLFRIRQLDLFALLILILIDIFSYFATRKLLIFGEGPRTTQQEIYKSLARFCLLKLHPEFEDYYEQCKAKPSSNVTAKILSSCSPKNAFFESVKFFKKNCEGA